MGTSGAYGGSGRQGWERARDLVGDIAPAVTSSTDAGGQPGGTEPDDERSVADLWDAIADALSDEDPLIDGEQDLEEQFPLSDLLPRPSMPRVATDRDATSGGGQAGLLRGATRSTGRKGARSSRRVIRGAARGGVALGGAYAIRRGDDAALRDLGLNLDEMRQLSPRMQCAMILNAVLGEGAHPDEYVLREAAAEQLKEILVSEDPPSEIDSLRGFIAKYLFGLALVEIRQRLGSGDITAGEAARKESRIRRWAEKRVRTIQVAVEQRLPVGRFKQTAAKLAREALRLLRAGSGD